MSVEFRQRKPAEYLKIVWRRKWVILLPAVAVTLAVAWAVWKLPDIYESTTLLTVRPASISPAIVPQLSDNDLSVRINNIGQEVVSRTSLEPLILKYNLYAKERASGQPMEALVERMRTRDINIRLNTSRNDVTNGFFLSYSGPDARVTKAVAEELASKYTRAQRDAVSNDAENTQRFFDDRLKQAQEQLQAIDNRRIQFMQERLGTLPDEGGALIGQLSGLREQQKALLNEIGRLRDQRTSVTNLMATLEQARQEQILDVSEQVADPKLSAPYAQLLNRKTQLEAERQTLLTTFKPKHPDVVAVQGQIDSVQRQMDEMVEEGKQKIEERRKKLQDRVSPQLAEYRNTVERIDGEVRRMQGTLAQTETEIGRIAERLNAVPGTTVGLEVINREYTSAKALYDQMLQQKERAGMAVDVANREQGEAIAVLDPANLPAQPVAPKRGLLTLLGLAAGLGFGLLLAAAFEFPRLLTVQTSEDAEHYTGLPVLASLPSLLTPRERRGLKLRRVAFGVAGVAAAVFAVPALYFVLTRLHIIEMLA